MFFHNRKSFYHLSLPYSVSENTLLKSPSTQKVVLLIVTSLGCSIFIVQREACAEFDTRRLFSHSGAEVKEESFSALTLNLSLRHVHTS